MWVRAQTEFGRGEVEMELAWAIKVLLLVELFHYGTAIMCYECNSATNYQCIDAFLPDSLRKNCSEHDKGSIKHNLCRKIVQMVEHTVNGQTVPSRVIRTCGWDDAKYKTSCYHRAGYGSRHEVCSCVTDFCNGAGTLATSGLLVITGVARMLF